MTGNYSCTVQGEGPGEHRLEVGAHPMDMVRPRVEAWAGRQIRRPDKRRRGGSGGATRSDFCWPILSRKASEPMIPERPYYKPPLVGKSKCSQVDERTLVKELGNLAP